MTVYERIDIEDVGLYEDWEICELSKGLYSFCLCDCCGACEEEEY